jgi:quercetin dioxygenase-like cupin family protein
MKWQTPMTQALVSVREDAVTTTAATVQVPDQVAPWDVVGDQIRPLLRGAAFEVFDLRGPRDSGPPPHSHPWDEAYFLLEGQVLVQAGDDEVRLQPGQFIHVPANTTHLYRILSEEARFLVITSPAGAADFFEDVDHSGATPADMPRLIEVAQRHRLDSPLFPR